MDAIKISVENDSNEEGEKKKVKQKKVVKKTAVKATKKKLDKKETKRNKVKRNKAKGGFISHLLVFVITASVVGGAIYYWQGDKGKKSLDKLQSDARNARISFDDKISSIKSKLQGVEDENKELKETTKELEEKTVLLDGALKKYSNSNLLISFQYPVLFGDVNVNVEETENGKKFVGTFSKNEQLVFGGVTPDYAVASTSISDPFLDTLGYERDGNDLILKNIHGEDSEYKVEAMRVVDTRFSEALMLNKDSFVVAGNDGESWDLGLGQNIGAVVNLKDTDFPGIAFVDKSTATFPLTDFEEMLKSIEVSEKE